MGISKDSKLLYTIADFNLTIITTKNKLRSCLLSQFLLLQYTLFTTASA